MTISRNYFGKLALSWTSFWMAAGLETRYRENLYAKNSQSWFKTKSRATPEDDITLRAFSYLDFKPVTRRSLAYVVALTLSLFGISALVFAAEILPPSNSVSFADFGEIIMQCLLRLINAFNPKKLRFRNRFYRRNSCET